MNEVEAVAKATQAVAETAGKGIDASREAGGFLRQVFGPALMELGGTAHDAVWLHRAERLCRLRDRYVAAQARLGFSGASRVVPLKFGLPLLEAASLEDDATLLDMFATLLANATSSNGAAEAERRTFISILRDMTPFDATVLLAAYRAPSADASKFPARTIYSNGLPHYYTFGELDARVIYPSKELHLSLWNLSKLACIEPAGFWLAGRRAGNDLIGELYPHASTALVSVTALGTALIEATTSPEARSEALPSMTEFYAARAEREA